MKFKQVTTILGTIYIAVSIFELGKLFGEERSYRQWKRFEDVILKQISVLTENESSSTSNAENNEDN